MNKIALFSVPRSGSTWLGQMINSSAKVAYRFQPNFAYSFPFELSEKSSKEEIEDFFDKLLNTKDPFVNAEISISSNKNIQFNKEKLTTLFFKETHYINVIENLLIKSDAKVIGLVRSPFSVINSWIKIPKEFDPSWEVKEEWVNGQSKNQNKASHYFGYNKWKEATQLFLKLKEEYPNQFYLISYDDLLQDTESEVKKIFDFCQLDFTKQTQAFINDSTSQTAKDKDAYSVFKSKKKDDAWKTKLPDFIVKEIKKDKEFQNLNTIFRWI